VECVKERILCDSYTPKKGNYLSAASPGCTAGDRNMAGESIRPIAEYWKIDPEVVLNTVQINVREARM
jgi:hypothetical protein